MIIAIRIFRINENVVLRMQIENSVIRDVAPPHAVSISLNVLPLDKSDIIGLHVNNVMCGACFAGPLVDRPCVARRFQVLILEQLRGYLCTDVKKRAVCGHFIQPHTSGVGNPVPLAAGSSLHRMYGTRNSLQGHSDRSSAGGIYLRYRGATILSLLTEDGH